MSYFCRAAMLGTDHLVIRSCVRNIFVNPR
uniref:Uncharacterized protein n=1 Tax=Arundo donax TaxID=35708 RepID=A0A0A9B132_ARUDO